MDEVKQKRRGIALRILALLTEHGFPGLTRGEIRNALKLPPDQEITARIRECRNYENYGGFDIRCEPPTTPEGSDTYWLPLQERVRARAFLDAWDRGKSTTFLAEHPSPLAKRREEAQEAMAAVAHSMSDRGAVHHINGDLNDNRTENIAIVELSDRG